METIIGMVCLSVFFLVCVGAVKLMQRSDFGRRLNNEIQRKGR